MKSLSVKLGVILIGLAIFGYTEVWGADWKLFVTDTKTIGYFDAESITRPSKDIVKVWIRCEYTDNGVTGKVEELGKKYENTVETTALQEINCSDKKRRTLSLTHYSKKGKVLYTSSHAGEWNDVIKKSIWEGLCEAVCK